MVSREVKRYVHEAVDEAEANERSRQRVVAIEHDLSLAREIQRGLIPNTPPALPNFDIAGMSQPADFTGGDYYDWQVLPDGRLLVVLADVSGHGIGPAMVMAVCRAYARASAPLIPELGPLLERVNALIHADIGEARFITLVIALADPASQEVQLLSAGHGPSLLYRAATASVEEFGGDGLPLGLMGDETYGRARSLDMASGDILMLLTDGFFEWQRPSDSEAFGIARIHDVLRQHAGEDAASLLQHLDKAVRDFTAVSNQGDDMTAVVIKRR